MLVRRGSRNNETAVSSQVAGARELLDDGALRVSGQWTPHPGALVHSSVRHALQNRLRADLNHRVFRTLHEINFCLGGKKVQYEKFTMVKERRRGLGGFP